MIRLLRWLWTGDGHAHRWSILRGHMLRTPGAVGTRFILQCGVCGWVKQKDVL